MPKDLDFEGTGHKGAEFEMKGYQERNLQNLLQTLKKKEVNESVKALADLEENEWNIIATSTSTLADVGGYLGQLSGLGGLGQSITDQLKLQMNQILAPIYNEIYGMIGSLIEPLYPYIEDAVNGLVEVMNLGTGAITALIEGRFDEWFDETRLRYQESGEIQKFQEWYSEEAIKWRRSLDPEFDELLRAADEAGTAGGVYSGHFDLDPETLKRILNAKMQQLDFKQPIRKGR